MLDTTDWTYILFSFILFSIAVAIIRMTFRRVTKDTNIPKEIKNRFRNVFGGNPGPNEARPVDNVDSMGFGSGSNKNDAGENFIISSGNKDNSINDEERIPNA